MKIINEKYVTLAEVKDILTKKEKVVVKDEKELLYEQKRALEHAQRYAKLKAKDIKELSGKISALDLSLTEEQIVKICDFLPQEVDDVRAIFAKDRFKYNEEDIKRITDIVSEYV